MASGKRRGRKFVDKRDWPAYSGQLVKRGEYWLELGWVKNWNSELDGMNAGKPGRPFEYPESLIELQGFWHANGIPYRTIQGISSKLVEIGQLPASNHYSDVNRRTNKLKFKMLPPSGGRLFLFSDGTGLQAKAGGEYLREKYGKKNRRWVQVIILGGPEGKEPVSFQVNVIQGSEAQSSRDQLKRLIDAGIDVAGFGGDGAMDDLELWKQLEEYGLDPGVKPDKNAREDSGSELRNKEVKERNKLGYKRWARKRKYGRRWPATEGVFSAFKRMFGEELAATSIRGLLQEAGLKVWAYQRLKRYGERA